MRIWAGRAEVGWPQPWPPGPTPRSRPLPAQQLIARRIFVRLVQLGEGRQDTRRQQAVGALRAPGDDPALFDRTLRHLTDRRLVTVGSADGEEPAVDLGHEAMIAHWPALRDWIEESRASELKRRRIERDADDWRRNGRDRGELYRRRKLADALELAPQPRPRAEPERRQVPGGGPATAPAGAGSAWDGGRRALGGIVWLAKAPVQAGVAERHEPRRSAPRYA